MCTIGTEVNTMLQVENKFEIGQEVYVIRKERVKEKCSACNGAGHKIIDGNEYYCSKCNGKGYSRYETKEEYQVKGLKTVTLIKSITQLQEKELIPQTVIIYNVDSEGMTLKEVPEHRLFTTKEEAEACCKELNEEESADGNR